MPDPKKLSIGTILTEIARELISLFLALLLVLPSALLRLIDRLAAERARRRGGLD